MKYHWSKESYSRSRPKNFCWHFVFFFSPRAFYPLKIHLCPNKFYIEEKHQRKKFPLWYRLFSKFFQRNQRSEAAGRHCHVHYKQTQKCLISLINNSHWEGTPKPPPKIYTEIKISQGNSFSILCNCKGVITASLDVESKTSKQGSSCQRRARKFLSGRKQAPPTVWEGALGRVARCHK